MQEVVIALVIASTVGVAMGMTVAQQRLVNPVAAALAFCVWLILSG